MNSKILFFTLASAALTLTDAAASAAPSVPKRAENATDAAVAGATPVVLTASLVCVRSQGCSSPHMSNGMFDHTVPFGFHYGIVLDDQRRVALDIANEFLSAVNIAVMAGQPVPCGGSARLAEELNRTVFLDSGAILFQCQVIYICVKDGRITAGKEAQDLINIHDDAFNKATLPVHCA